MVTLNPEAKEFLSELLAEDRVLSKKEIRQRYYSHRNYHKIDEARFTLADATYAQIKIVPTIINNLLWGESGALLAGDLLLSQGYPLDQCMSLGRNLNQIIAGANKERIIHKRKGAKPYGYYRDPSPA